MPDNLTTARNGDVEGEIPRTNVENIMLIDMVLLLKREEILIVVD